VDPGEWHWQTETHRKLPGQRSTPTQELLCLEATLHMHLSWGAKAIGAEQSVDLEERKRTIVSRFFTPSASLSSHVSLLPPIIQPFQSLLNFNPSKNCYMQFLRLWSSDWRCKPKFLYTELNTNQKPKNNSHCWCCNRFNRNQRTRSHQKRWRFLPSDRCRGKLSRP
jgi:hypothetical protein